ncbi:GAF domain-containing protein [Jatrophihabitans sp. YIM 134969]
MTVILVRPEVGIPHPAPEVRPVVPPHELVVNRRVGAAVFHALPDAGAVAGLDVLVETLCDLLDVDYAGVHLFDGDEHQVLVSSDPEPHPPLPRSDTLCGVLVDRHTAEYAGADGATNGWDVVEVPDTREDPSLPSVFAGEVAPVRFYAAAPLRDHAGRPIGALCVIAHHPRALTCTERRTLVVMAVAASALLMRCVEPLDG